MDNYITDRLAKLKAAFDEGERYPDVTSDLPGELSEDGIREWVSVTCEGRHWGHFMEVLHLITGRTEESLGAMETFLDLKGKTGPDMASHLVAWVMTGSPYLLAISQSKDGTMAFVD